MTWLQSWVEILLQGGKCSLLAGKWLWWLSLVSSSCKRRNHPGSTITCPRFPGFFFQNNNNNSSQEHARAHTHTQTHSRVHTHPDTLPRNCAVHTPIHTTSAHIHTRTHTPSLTHPHSHTHTPHTPACSLIHTHPQEARRLLGRVASLRFALEGSAKEMVRLPKDRSSLILPRVGRRLGSAVR